MENPPAIVIIHHTGYQRVYDQIVAIDEKVKKLTQTYHEDDPLLFFGLADVVESSSEAGVQYAKLAHGALSYSEIDELLDQDPL